MSYERVLEFSAKCDDSSFPIQKIEICHFPRSGLCIEVYFNMDIPDAIRALNEDGVEDLLNCINADQVEDMLHLLVENCSLPAFVNEECLRQSKQLRYMLNPVDRVLIAHRIMA